MKVKPSIVARLDTHLHVKADDIPVELHVPLHEALSYPNRAKETARKEKMRGWDKMPDEIVLYEDDGEWVKIPRGFRWQFEQAMADFEIEIDWIDNRSSDPVFRVLPSFPLRPHQGPAAEAIVRETDGIVKAPPGSGKTVTVLEAIRRCRQRRNLILIDKINIARQWQKRAQQFLPDLEVGVIGNGNWEECEVTIATVQTLWARRDELDDEWWAQWGFVCIDECHHQTANTFQHVMQMFPAKYRFGVSATPDKTGDYEIAISVLGDEIHETTRQELRSLGILVTPLIMTVETEFEFPYHGTFTAKKGKSCGIEGCKKSGQRHLHRNNYEKLIKALIADDYRNAMIAHCINMNRGHHNLVLSKRLEHFDNIAQYVDPEIPAYWLTGKESEAEREEITRVIESSDESVIYSTIADEALDIPVLSRLYLPFPTKNIGLIRQQIGRVERAAPGKEDAVVFDFADFLCGVLKKQYLARRWECYAEDLFKVEIVATEDLLQEAA